MAITFPAAPTNGQIYTDPTSGQSWTWDGTKWKGSSSTAYWKRTGTAVEPYTAGDTIQGQLVPTNGPLAGFRNKIINGDFRINQRGGVKIPAVVNTYGFDRWRANNATHIEQIIEDAPAGQYTLWCEGGTADTMTANIANTSQIASGPSNVPLTFNYNGTGNLSIIVPGVVTKVQCEPGPVATPFEHRPIGTELALCQRYFWTNYNTGTAVGSVTLSGYIFFTRWNDAGNVSYNSVQCPVPMRTAPTVTGYSTGGVSGVWTDNASVNRTFGIVNPGTMAFTVTSAGSGANTTGQIYGHVAASSEL